MAKIDFLGKGDVAGHHFSVPFYTLKADRKKSVGDVDLDGNLIIHGDNLLALKSLLPRYAAKVKCIYIDPPYNTGNEDWVYNDKVNSPLIKDWLGKAVDREDQTRHDKWLCMMYPRLQLLKELLADDGVIFISIDDNEQHRLRFLMDEVFGEENFIGNITREQSSGSKNDTGSNKVVSTTDQILTYSKSKSLFHFYPLLVKPNKKYKYFDGKSKFNIRALEMQGGDDTLPLRERMGYSIYYNDVINKLQIRFDYDLKNQGAYKKPDSNLIDSGYKCYRPRKRGGEFGIWRWGKETFLERYYENNVYFDNERVYLKERATEFIEKYPDSLCLGFLNTQGTNELKTIFNGEKIFAFPKPANLIKYLIQLTTKDNDLILDSFAGSGTTAHAVLALNKEDGGNRKFILVECEAYANKITAERVRRVIKGVPNAKDENLKKGLGGSFTYATLGEEIDHEKILTGESMPSWSELARHVFWLATGETLNKQPKQNKQSFVGKHKNDSVYLLYEPDINFLQSNKATLTGDMADKLGEKRKKGERILYYAAAAYISPKDMERLGIVFCQLPYAITKKQPSTR